MKGIGSCIILGFAMSIELKKYHFGKIVLTHVMSEMLSFSKLQLTATNQVCLKRRNLQKKWNRYSA